MRFLLSAMTLITFLAAAPAVAQEDIVPELPLEGEVAPVEPVVPVESAIVPPVDDVPMQAAKTAQQRIDDLFAELKREGDAAKAKRIADNIWSEWFRSGSATIDLFMGWANDAMRTKDNNRALDLLDQVVTRAPDYAEGWNRRATLHFSMANFAKSMTDIQKVLELEPRHFGALSGMAAILERNGSKEAALGAWERALAVYPGMKAAQDSVIRLSDELGGDPA